MKNVLIACILVVILAACSKRQSPEHLASNERQHRLEKESPSQINWEEQLSRLITNDFSNLKVISRVTADIHKPREFGMSAEDITLFTKSTCKNIFEPTIQVFTNDDVPNEVLADKNIDEVAAVEVRVMISHNDSDAIYYVESKFIVAGTLAAIEIPALGLTPKTNFTDGNLLRHSISSCLTELAERVRKAKGKK